jgi:A/G-specific adenine glycosylase
MLQQTRVAAVLDHYARWMERFPSIEALAEAEEDDVLAAWSGLGYYRRARFLHQGAKRVSGEFGGRLPRTAAELRRLPGIGAYTSAAIASIAFGEAAAVVDGNVERVLLRQTGCGEPGAKETEATLTAGQVQALAAQLLDPERPGDFNQAMMELGATVCLPQAPLCLHCPVQKSCRTRGEHSTAKRRPTTDDELQYALWRRGSPGALQVLLERRPSTATVMPGMWELPRLGNANGASERPLIRLRHAIMQTNFRVSVFEAAGTPGGTGSDDLRWIEAAKLSELPLTGLARKILLRLGLSAPLLPEKRDKKNPAAARRNPMK